MESLQRVHLLSSLSLDVDSCLSLYVTRIHDEEHETNGRGMSRWQQNKKLRLVGGEQRVTN